MEKQRQLKILSIVALVLAISAMTLGFAAFSTTLNISSSASVTPSSSDFSVKFSTSKDSLVVNVVSPSSKSDGITATSGVIENSITPSLTNLSANFTNPGQYVEYTVYARNEGEYTAYLNNINYLGNKTCIASTGTTESLVQSACNSINVTVTIGSTTYDDTTPITSHALAKGAGEEIKVRLEYSENGTAVDGSFNITFPSVSLVYSTLDDSSIQPSTPSTKVCTYVDSEDDTGSAIGTIDLSDVVTCGTESFYVMSNANDKVTMLSMYNLLVGNSIDSNSNVTPLTNPTGIQDNSASGTFMNQNYIIGVTKFSNVNSSYSGSIVEDYVNSYKTFLIGLGTNVTSARLITKEELENLGCSSYNTCEDAPSWIYSSRYWVGSSYDAQNVWFVSSNQYGGFAWSKYDDDSFGVRPVIEIPLSEF